jgi:hypothetical protein
MALTTPPSSFFRCEGGVKESNQKSERFTSNKGCNVSRSNSCVRSITQGFAKIWVRVFDVVQLPPFELRVDRLPLPEVRDVATSPLLLVFLLHCSSSRTPPFRLSLARLDLGDPLWVVALATLLAAWLLLTFRVSV